MKPNASACSCIASAPSSIASWANAVLHDHPIAVRNEIRLGLHCVPPSLSTSPRRRWSPAAGSSAGGHHRGGVPVAAPMRGGGGDQLERRARAAGGLDRAVQQRLVRVLVEPVVVLRHGAEVVGRQQVGVVRRQRHHRQDLAGLSARGPRPRPALPRRAPAARRTRRSAPSGLIVSETRRPWSGCRDQVHQPGHEQPGVVAGQHLVLALLHAGLGVVGEPAGHRGVLERLRVGALVLVLVVARVAHRDRLAVDQDRAALAAEGLLR